MPGISGILLVILVTGVIAVNGFTDAPNAITGVVVTKTMTYRGAVWLAAVCNLLGIGVMGWLNASVAETMLSLVDFSASPEQGTAALCAAMLSIILLAVGAWYFGIPTSESHALAAALAGAGLALGGELQTGGWYRILAGLALSLGAGMLLGFLLMGFLDGPLQRVRASRLGQVQIAGAAAMSFMHGAQDGQKFIAVFILAECLAAGQMPTGGISLREHVPALFLCALTMALGTALGGRRIIETVGSRMVSMDRPQAICADIGGALCLGIASLTGIPMSTTHTKTAAVMGAGFGGRDGGVNPRIVGGMFAAWAVTFPVCGALGYCLTCLFLW